MKNEPSKWRVEEQDGANACRDLVVEASSWETAIEAVWQTWGLDHDLRRAGVEIGLSATQVFIRGTSFRYRIARERPPPKRVVPRPASSIPPPLEAEAKKPEAKKPPPLKTETKKSEPRPRKGDLPSGRSLFGKLPRPSSPDLEDARPAPRASTPDRELARRASQPDREEIATSDGKLRVATPPPLPVSALRAADADTDAQPERPPSIIPMPVVDVGKSSPPPAEPAAVAQPPAPAAAPAPEPDSAPPPAAPARPIPKLSARRLQVLVSGAVQLYTREQDPKNGAPVIYRQVGYALPMGTEEEEAEAFARWMLQQLQQQVPEGSAPRLFHLAVYDEMFTGEPPILALCKLEWKEWKDRISVSFPRRGDDSVVVSPPRARTPSMHPDLSAPSTPPGVPGTAKPPGRAAALFLPPVTPPSFAVQPPPKAPAAATSDEPAGSDES